MFHLCFLSHMAPRNSAVISTPPLHAGNPPAAAPSIAEVVAVASKPAWEGTSPGACRGKGWRLLKETEMAALPQRRGTSPLLQLSPKSTGLILLPLFFPPLSGPNCLCGDLSCPFGYLKSFVRVL